MCGIFTHNIYSKIFKWTTDRHINTMLSERRQTQKVKLSHLVEIQQLAKLCSSDRNQNNGNLCVLGMNWKEA